MKTFSRTALSLLLLGGLSGAPTICSASEARTGATGGLTTLLTDETTDLNLFLDGNPAGLALLSSRDRVDLTGQWTSFDKAGPWGANRRQLFTTLPQTLDDVVRYEGLMVFPFPNWAFQVASDLSSAQGFPVTAFLDGTGNSSRYRALVRGACAVPFGAVGLELLDLQVDERFDTGTYDPSVSVLSGSSSQNQLLLKTGILAAFPNPPEPGAPRWQAGGFFAFQLGPSSKNQSLDLFAAGPVSFTVNQTATSTGYRSAGAELLYEVPSELQVRFSALVTNLGIDLEQSVPSPTLTFNDLAKYHASDLQWAVLKGSFRCVTPGEGEEVLKTGGSLSLDLNNGNFFSPGGTVALSGLDRQSLNILAGVGLESNREYTMGIQWRSRNYLTGQSASGPAGPLSDGSDLYQMVFGGEKWLSASWAFRMGLTVQEDLYPGGLSTLTTAVNSGAGLEQTFGRADLRVTLGQTTDLRNSSNAIGTIGVQLSSTFFF